MQCSSALHQCTHLISGGMLSPKNVSESIPCGMVLTTALAWASPFNADQRFELLLRRALRPPAALAAMALAGATVSVGGQAGSHDTGTAAVEVRREQIKLIPGSDRFLFSLIWPRSGRTCPVLGTCRRASTPNASQSSPTSGMSQQEDTEAALHQDEERLSIITFNMWCLPGGLSPVQVGFAKRVRNADMVPRPNRPLCTTAGPTHAGLGQ